jgi:hypothetical protein
MCTVLDTMLIIPERRTEAILRRLENNIVCVPVCIYIYGSAHCFSQGDSRPEIIVICKEDK